MEPEQGSVECVTLNKEQSHKITYLKWKTDNAVEGRVLVCVHGLARTARDFDFIAKSLAENDGYTVYSLNMAGRLDSDRIPAENYTYPQYASDIVTFLKKHDLKKFDYLGTSMGGLIALVLGNEDNQQKEGFEMNKVIFNDICPFIPRECILRLAQYVGKQKYFETLEEVVAFIKHHYPFGNLTDEQWTHFAKYTVLPKAEGGFELHYDMNIGNAFKDTSQLKDVDLWPLWDTFKCNQFLLLRGETSDILLKKSVEEIKPRGKKGIENMDEWFQFKEFEGCGHVPPLAPAGEIKVVRDFLFK